MQIDYILVRSMYRSVYNLYFLRTDIIFTSVISCIFHTRLFRSCLPGADIRANCYFPINIQINVWVSANDDRALTLIKALTAVQS